MQHCTEVAYPLRTRGALTLRPSARVRMRFDGHVSGVMVDMRATAEPGRTQRLRGPRRRDSATAPLHDLPAERLPCAAILDIFVLYAPPEGEPGLLGAHPHARLRQALEAPGSGRRRRDKRLARDRHAAVRAA